MTAWTSRVLLTLAAVAAVARGDIAATDAAEPAVQSADPAEATQGGAAQPEGELAAAVPSAAADDTLAGTIHDAGAGSPSPDERDDGAEAVTLDSPAELAPTSIPPAPDASRCNGHGAPAPSGGCVCEDSWCHVPHGAHTCQGKVDGRFYPDCATCPAGARVLPEGAACSPCPANTYNALANATECARCPPGALATSGAKRASDCKCNALKPDYAYDDLADSSLGACAAASRWGAAASGPLGLPFGARCELHGLKLTPTCTWSRAEVRAIGCPCGAFDGLEVRYGRTDEGDLDLYGFKLSCQRRWGSWAKLLFKARERHASAGTQCAEGDAITGLEVVYSRWERGDRDLYDFRLQCAGVWLDEPLALHAVRPRRRPSAQHTARIECGPGEAACGLEVSRARQEDGDIDQLDFRLRCAPLYGGGLSGRSR